MAIAVRELVAHTMHGDRAVALALLATQLLTKRISERLWVLGRSVDVGPCKIAGKWRLTIRQLVMGLGVVLELDPGADLLSREKGP
jgi:hypothetical protein